MKTTVAVFMGGKSVEHEVSIISALQVVHAIDKEKYNVLPIYISKENKFYFSEKLKDIQTFKDMELLKTQCDEIYFTHENGQMIVNKVKGVFKKVLAKIDVAFPVVHGLNVEDGTLQGFLEMYNIPYVGCDVGASSAGMNKIFFKKIVKESGIPCIDYAEIYKADYAENEDKVKKEVLSKLSLPIILKPADLGSSVGIKVVKSEEEFKEAVEFVFEFTDKILVEKCITNLREINASVIGNYEECEVSLLEQPIKQDEILSFEDKYMSEGGNKGGKSSGMSSLTRKLPAELPEDVENQIIEMSKKVFKVLNCEGVARIDYIIDDDTNTVYVNEINTIPGSLAFYLWEPKGVKFDALCDKAIKLAIKRSARREKIIYSNNVNILNMHMKK